MFEYLESIDRSIVLAVNRWHTPFLDNFFWITSKTLTWAPFYLLLLFLVWRNSNWRTTFIFLASALLLVALVDSSTTYLFKETVARYRPSHNLLLENQLHFYQKSNGELYRGGQYGFFSSHASNNAAIALFAWFFLRNAYSKLKWFLMGAVVLISLSRIYLSVHYLSDIICGLLWGGCWAFILWKVLSKTLLKQDK